MLIRHTKGLSKNAGTPRSGVCANWLAVLALVLGTSTAGWAEGISVSQSIDKTALAFEDSLLFEITLQWDGPQWAYRFDKPLDPYFERLKTSGFASSISSTGTKPEEVVTTKRFRYTLVPTLAGVGKIDPVTISYIAMPDSTPGELVTEAMTVNIREPVPVSTDSGGLPSTAVLIVIAVVFLGGVTAGVVVVSKKKTKRPEPPKPPKDEFLTGLAELKETAGNDLKTFQSGLGDLLAAYLKHRYDIQAATLDDEAVTAALESTDLSPNARDRIAFWYVEARKDKFRPVTSAPGDTIRLESEVRAVFSNLPS